MLRVKCFPHVICCFLLTRRQRSRRRSPLLDDFTRTLLNFTYNIFALFQRKTQRNPPVFAPNLLANIECPSGNSKPSYRAARYDRRRACSSLAKRVHSVERLRGKSRPASRCLRKTAAFHGAPDIDCRSQRTEWSPQRNMGICPSDTASRSMRPLGSCASAAVVNMPRQEHTRPVGKFICPRKAANDVCKTA